MSYLGFPRIHFAGAFFSNPANLNNQSINYDNAATGEPLIYETGTYNNPTGVAQYFFRDCVVTRVVGADGQPVGGDPLLGAGVDTVNPWDPKTDSEGKNYILAKMVDIDADMQFRTELYGLRIYVKSASGYGFFGGVGIPQLRDLYFNRGAGGDETMQVACGTWHQRIHVEKWLVPAEGGSQTLDLLAAGHGSELDMKLSVDMFQCSPIHEFTTGNMYCYGRLMATIGRSEASNPTQIVPGRRLYSPISFESSKVSEDSVVLTRQAAEESVEKNPPSKLWWNNTDARVERADGQAYLLVDMGTSTPLVESQPPSKGQFDLGGSLTLGYLRDTGRFVAFEQQGYTQSGSFVSVTEQLEDYVTLEAANAYRNSVYLANAGVVQVALKDREAQAIATASLAMTVNDGVVLRENPGGYYVNFERASCRLPPNTSTPAGDQVVRLIGFQYGQPLDQLGKLKDVDLGFQTLSVVYGNRSSGQFPQSRNQATDRFSVHLDGEPIAGLPGHFDMTVKTGPGHPFPPPPQDGDYNSWLRKPMDSQLCFVQASAKGVMIGENPFIPRVPYIPAVTVLFWQDQWISATPNWTDNIGPILSVYSELYPGMRGLVDLGDEATVKSYAKALYDRFRLEVEDPAFMPVVRDMSPATLRMMTAWLQQQIGSSTQAT